MGEDFYDDEEYEDDDEGGFEEEDFEATGAELKEKTALGMDAFAMVFSFIALIASSLLIGYFVLWNVYDLRLGVMPQKVIPPQGASFEVVGFGCDKSISDVYNYAILKGGTNDGLEQGLVLYVNHEGVKASSSNATLKLVVTEEIYEDICRADIVEMHMTSKDYESVPPGEIHIDAKNALANKWKTLVRQTSAAENINWLMGSAEEKKTPKAYVASWGKDQEIVYEVETNYSDMQRKNPGE